jgi:Fic family protein
VIGADSKEPEATRAGRHVLQPSGYRAFIPAALPPRPPLVIDDEMWDLLSKADRALGRLDGATDILPNPDLFVFLYVRKEAVLSSQIEGTQATLLDLLEFEADLLRRDSPHDVAEVVNYIDAMNHGLARLAELPVSLRLIREIHHRLMRGVRGGTRDPGDFRTSQNWIGPPGSTIASAAFVPPPPHQLDHALGDLERFIHDPTPMPYLIKVGLIHAQFETIHPFLDGNGRVGRLLITILLCEKEILNRPLLYLSHYFKQRRFEYYNLLQRTRDAGDWEAWIKFFLRGVFDVSQAAAQTARAIVSLREQHRTRLLSEFGRSAGPAGGLLEFLYQQPIVSVQMVRHRTGLSYSNANALVGRLVELGILTEVTGQRRNRRFSYQPLLALFEDEAPTLTA